MDKIREIIDKHTEGNYLISESDKEKMSEDILNLFDVRISFLIGKWLERQKYFSEVAEKTEKIEHAIRFNAKAQATRDCWKELEQLKNES